MKKPIEITTPLPVQISTAYISHGGGPLPLLEIQTNGEANSPQYHKEMIEALKTLSADLPRPDVIIVISAHWEEAEVSVTTSPQPPLVYDYYGFPQEAYSLKYPAKGEVSLATLLLKRLTEQGIAVREDRARGFDHGMFIPLSIMYPNVDVPCIQVSITSCLNTERHVLLGEAIRKAVERGIRPVNSDATDQVNILVLGSGSSFHNMQGFFDSSDDAMRKATRFNNWLQTTMQTSAYSENERKTRLVEWYSAPDARYAHPREEHLLPLHVCYGVNNRAVDKAMSLTLLTKPASMFVWSD
ncbi:DODA-type extradiol aromatic ring-opening family dioxygenase [Alteromonas sp. PRIM-21]|uniref:DODA-type extradiol aromatic ring-opening family dioxygenase n=1 Tax=Alteromonas sp. PRIM-21 TaxID=1454978 RepID=UPI0022B96C54|nr:class III extradiol ring-cleavage dioxygenase [Alteromonas sp. PRIM-21]MCZ8529205.1 dioxygenase [Alteromonas sp. PRIM-21]